MTEQLGALTAATSDAQTSLRPKIVRSSGTLPEYLWSRLGHLLPGALVPGEPVEGDFSTPVPPLDDGRSERIDFALLSFYQCNSS